MASNFMRMNEGSDYSLRFQPKERLKAYLFGGIVLLASLAMGETVYGVLFLKFDGGIERIPIEVACGLVLAWLATKSVCDACQARKQRSARLNFIVARGQKIRGALEGLMPLAHPAKDQQSIRVIREEMDRIDLAVKEMLQS